MLIVFWVLVLSSDSIRTTTYYFSEAGSMATYKHYFFTKRHLGAEFQVNRSIITIFADITIRGPIPTFFQINFPETISVI